MRCAVLLVFQDVIYTFIFFLFTLRLLNIKLGECDKLPTGLCQPCVSKVEELQQFYDNCHETQKMLAVQYSLHQEDECTNGQDLLMQSGLANINLKEDVQQVELLPANEEPSTCMTLSLIHI